MLPWKWTRARSGACMCVSVCVCECVSDFLPRSTERPNEKGSLLKRAFFFCCLCNQRSPGRWSLRGGQQLSEDHSVSRENDEHVTRRYPNGRVLSGLIKKKKGRARRHRIQIAFFIAPWWTCGGERATSTATTATTKEKYKPFNVIFGPDLDATVFFLLPLLLLLLLFARALISVSFEKYHYSPITITTPTSSCAKAMAPSTSWIFRASNWTTPAPTRSSRATSTERPRRSSRSKSKPVRATLDVSLSRIVCHKTVAHRRPLAQVQPTLAIGTGDSW